MIPESDYEAFYAMTAPLQSELKRYCLTKTGSAWDADDLLQETLVKAYKWHTQFPERDITKPFMYRIAANAWIDMCRRNKKHSSIELDESELPAVQYEEWSHDDVREAIELLSDRLEPKQVVLILLIDIFDFSAKEAAGMFGQSEGAIKAALHRARSRLNKAVESHPERWDDAVLSSPRGGLSIEVFEAFVDAFRRADPYAIFQSYQSMLKDGVKLDKIELRGNILYFTILDPDGNALTITSRWPGNPIG